MLAILFKYQAIFADTSSFCLRRLLSFGHVMRRVVTGNILRFVLFNSPALLLLFTAWLLLLTACVRTRV